MGKPEILVGKSNGSRHPVRRLDSRGRDSAYERGGDARRKFWIKGRTIRKVMTGWEKKQKKFMQGKMPRAKIHAKKKVKKKNSCRRKVQL